MIIILIFRLYFLILALFVLNITSRLVFRELGVRAGLVSYFACLFWPLFLFSRRGRIKLLGKVGDL